MVDRFNIKIIYVPYTNKHKSQIGEIGTQPPVALAVRVLCFKSQGPWFNPWARLLCYVLHVFNVYDIYSMVWYTQVELVLVISFLARKFRYLNIKIDLAIFQKDEEGELKSETG